MSLTERLQEANARELREVNADIERITLQKTITRPTEYPTIMVKVGNTFTSRAILAWFFTWTLCAAGFVLVMTIAATLAKALKVLVP
jgi:hypothetical protein